MSRRIHDLTPRSLDALPPACRSCVFWEVPDAPRGPATRTGDEHRRRAAKEAWWQATQLEWGPGGKTLHVGDTAVGYATFGPPEHFPRARRMGALVSDDALLLATLWIDPEHRGHGYARMLLQAVLRETHRHRSRALEAIGVRHGQGTPCVVPEWFLLANGFTVKREDPFYPLLRLDLRQTTRLQESVGHALEEVLSVLSRRERAPAPSRPAMEAVWHQL